MEKNIITTHIHKLPYTKNLVYPKLIVYIARTVYKLIITNIVLCLQLDKYIK